MKTAAAKPVPPPAPVGKVRAVSGYRLPGEGSSMVISAVTVVALLSLWWLATHLGWIRGFVPATPERYSAPLSAP